MLVLEEFSEPYLEDKEENTKVTALEKILRGNKASASMVCGYEGSGKHSFVYRVLSKLREHSSCKIVEINSVEILKNNNLAIEQLRNIMRMISIVEVRESTKIVIGEVVSITDDKIHLRTRDMESVFEIGTKIKDELRNERVFVGDIIKIYKEFGFVTRVGRVKDPASNGDNPLVNLTAEGECIRNEMVPTILSLDELDIINYNEKAEDNLYANIYISERIQNEVDRNVCKWLKETKATFSRGVVIINGCEMFNEESIRLIFDLRSCLFSPHFILIYNGVPQFESIGEFRFLINPKIPREIIKLKATHYSVDMSEEVLILLSELSSKLSITKILAIMKSAIYKNIITYESLNRILSLFDF